mmetsp:Transcript_2499/g.3408  ORF Transcript_2499/g.3408 Transcript_2499/m.3408 type:complete len:316 (-) Transcript_2499:129-1076(-)
MMSPTPSQNPLPPSPTLSRRKGWANREDIPFGLTASESPKLWPNQNRKHTLESRPYQLRNSEDKRPRQKSDRDEKHPMFSLCIICKEGEEKGTENVENKRKTVESEDGCAEKEESISNEGRFDRQNVDRGTEDREDIQSNFQSEQEDDDSDNDDDNPHPIDFPVADVDVEEAICSGDVVEVARLLESGYEANTSCGEDDEPMIQVAAAEFQLDVVKLLVEKGAVLNSKVLSAACQSIGNTESDYDRIDIVRYLVDAKAEVTTRCLWEVASMEDPSLDVVDFLMEKLQPNAAVQILKDARNAWKDAVDNLRCNLNS